MTYTIIGTGNMAWFLVTRLNAAGFVCKGVYGRNHASAIELAAHADAPVLEQISDIDDLSDCCFLAVSDTAVNSLAKQLSFRNTVLIHHAGALPIPQIAAVANSGVLWFIYSIIKSDLPVHRDIPAVFEAATERAKHTILKVANLISDIVCEADWQQRQWLHLSAVMGNNFVNHLLSIIDQICREQNLPADLLKPIIWQTLTRTGERSPLELQSGPARRHDLETMEKHLALLEDHPEWREVYEKLSRSIKKMYR